MGNEGMKHEFMVPYTPEQNAVSERNNRTIMEAICSCIFHNQVDPKFWAEAMDNIVYSLNRTCSRNQHDIAPFEAYTGHKPSLSHMKLFGCPVFIHIPKDQRKKLSPKAKVRIFFGYADNTKGYRIYDIAKKEAILSKDVIFDDKRFVTSTST
jgi:hypothetical protein